MPTNLVKIDMNECFSCGGKKLQDGGTVNIDRFKSNLLSAEHGALLQKEGYNPYKSMNKDGAMGKYQFLESVWGSNIRDFAKETGFRYESPEDFLNNSALQEKYFDHYLETELLPQAKKIMTSTDATEFMTEEQVMSLVHFLGYPEAKKTIQNKDFLSPKSYKTTANDYLENAGYGRVYSPTRQRMMEREEVKENKIEQRNPQIIIAETQAAEEQKPPDPFGLKDALLEKILTKDKPQQPQESQESQTLRNYRETIAKTPIFQEGGVKKKLDEEYSKLTSQGAREVNGKVLLPLFLIKTGLNQQ